MRNNLLLLSLSCFLCLSACKNETKKKSTEEKEVQENQEEIKQENSSSLKQQKGDLSLYPASLAKEFPNAELTLKKPLASDIKAGKHQFEFEVGNYQLTKQTPDAEERHCANSAKGQHIHFILNNAPYRAEYEPEFEAELMEGNNVVLAFLSRSYHESIKHQSAYIFKNFSIGESAFQFDENAPHLFYSRPKGEYEGEYTEKILVDFFLLNTTLSEDGNKVRLSIDEETFILTNWQSYFVEGLSKGKHTFRLELLDAKGELIDGPFNDSGERVIELL